MSVGYVFLGLIAGILSFFGALILGASFWSALLLYSATGASVTIVLPALQFAHDWCTGAIPGQFSRVQRGDAAL